MARKAKSDLPAEVEVSPTDATKVRCKLCAPYMRASSHSIWINRTSLRLHIISKFHLDALKKAEIDAGRRAEIEQTRAADMQRVQQMQAQFAAVNHLDLHLPQSRPSKNPPDATPQEQEMWEAFDAGETFDVSAGQNPGSRDEARLLYQLDNLDDWHLDPFSGGFDFASGVDETLTNVLQNMNMDHEEPSTDEIHNVEFGQTLPPQDSQWFPYQTQTLFLLDSLDNLPRLRISDSLMKMFLWVMREAGARDVPTFGELRRVQTHLRKGSGIPSMPFKSVQGNIFYMNDIRKLIAKDYANPLVRPHLRFYPEIPDGPISEIWHAEKWRKDIDFRQLSPMYKAGSRHFYVLEFARLKNGRLVVPIRWLTHKGAVKADAYDVNIANDGTALIVDSNVIMINASDLEDTFLDLLDKGDVPVCDPKSAELRELMPNPDRIKADGDPLYTSFVDYFGDDVSGNKSKSWNKHWNAYTAHRNLPRQLLQQEFHVHFLSTSPHATIGEQFQAFKSQVEDTHREPIIVYDVENRETAKVQLFVNSDRSDNPMQSEMSGHIGGKGNCPCRKCEVGGTMKEKESNEGYHSFFKPGKLRSASTTLETIREQVALACLGVESDVKKSQTKTGVKDAYTQYWIDHLITEARQLRKAGKSKLEVEKQLTEWVNDNEEKIYNGCFKLKGFDPTQDSPVELLHTILLGVLKYVWHMSHTTWSAEDKKKYGLRLQATDIKGLSIPPIRASYILQYANSLIGRQFRVLGQTTAFHVYDICPLVVFSLWKAVGELTALLWLPEIDDMEVYLADVNTATNNVLDLFVQIDPLKIISKIKLHLLTHLAEDIRQFGPLIGESTEIFECFNAIFRFCSILSNHMAPSRDISEQLGDQEGFKQRVTGGWWMNPETKAWEQASAHVRSYLHEHSALRGNLGWSETTVLTPGTIRLQPYMTTKERSRERPHKAWHSTLASKAINAPEFSRGTEHQVFSATFLVSAAGDQCSVDSWVFAMSLVTKTSVVGRVLEIFAFNSDGEEPIAVLDVFQVGASRHDVFGMPTLLKSFEEASVLIVPTKNIHFSFNAQHDCRQAGCSATGRVIRLQERMKSDVTEAVIEHKTLEKFIINLHSLHNGHLLRKALPRHLTQPLPIIDPPLRQQKHYEIASELRPKQNKKRATTKSNREATMKLRKDHGKQKATTSSTVEEVDSVSGARKKRKRVEIESETPPVELESEDEAPADYGQEEGNESDGGNVEMGE